MTFAQTVAITPDTYISVVLLIAVVGAAVKITLLLAEIKFELKGVRRMGKQVAHMESHLLLFEEDVNNLFGALRSMDTPEKLPELTRRARFRPFPVEDNE